MADFVVGLLKLRLQFVYPLLTLLQLALGDPKQIRESCIINYTVDKYRCSAIQTSVCARTWSSWFLV